MMKPKIKVGIQGEEETFFGPGTSQLMELIQETSSVRSACEQMGMSYSKAWKILNRIERELGHAVISRTRGGTAGGHTSLTEYGQAYLETYQEYDQRVQVYALQEMEKLFAEFKQ